MFLFRSQNNNIQNGKYLKSTKKIVQEAKSHILQCYLNLIAASLGSNLPAWKSTVSLFNKNPAYRKLK